MQNFIFARNGANKLQLCLEYSFAIRKPVICQFSMCKTLTFWFAIRKPVICQFSMCETAKSLSTIKIGQSDFLKDHKIS